MLKYKIYFYMNSISAALLALSLIFIYYSDHFISSKESFLAANSREIQRMYLDGKNRKTSEFYNISTFKIYKDSVQQDVITYICDGVNIIILNDKNILVFNKKLINYYRNRKGSSEYKIICKNIIKLLDELFDQGNRNMYSIGRIVFMKEEQKVYFCGEGTESIYVEDISIIYKLCIFNK